MRVPDGLSDAWRSQIDLPLAWFVQGEIFGAQLERVAASAFSRDLRFGLYADALDVLSRQYPSGTDVIGEPGVLHPASYPLIAYYRGFCRYALGKDGSADFAAASSMPTSYVFPNRAESLA